MEAGGIEPPSRDGFRATSTCVVDRLMSGGRAPVDRLSNAPAGLVSYRGTVRRRASASPLIGVLRVSGRHPLNGLPISRRPWRSYTRQLRFFCQVFYEASRPPRHAIVPSTRPVESNSPPNTVSIRLISAADKVCFQALSCDGNPGGEFLVQFERLGTGG